jgi:4-amino-4-deoxychorismate lyase
MPVNLAWIDGRWGGPDDLQLPLSDRGLQLADGLFETVLVLDGTPQLLPEHLARWVASAELLGMEPPPSQQDLSGLIDEAIVKS